MRGRRAPAHAPLTECWAYGSAWRATRPRLWPTAGPAPPSSWSCGATTQHSRAQRQAERGGARHRGPAAACNRRPQTLTPGLRHRHKAPLPACSPQIQRVGPFQPNAAEALEQLLAQAELGRRGGGRGRGGGSGGGGRKGAQAGECGQPADASLPLRPAQVLQQLQQLCLLPVIS